MASAVVPNGVPQDYEGSPDRVGPADDLAYDDTVDYRYAEDPGSTQAIISVQDTGGYGEEVSYVEEAGYVQDTSGYVEEAGYVQDTSGYGEEPGYVQDASGYGEEPGYVQDANGHVEEVSYVDHTDAYGATFLAGGSGAITSDVVVARQEDRFGGIKVGSAFFGWLSAMGVAILLTACAAIAGTAAGLLTGRDANVLSGLESSQTIGMTGTIVLLFIVFISFYSGGYVAGRMARFNGVGQGLMVWLWAVLMAGVAAALSMIIGGTVNVGPASNGFPDVAFFGGQVSISHLIAGIVAAAVGLISAVLGGNVGMLYHRRVDRAGFQNPRKMRSSSE